ncbi:MAG TPA: cytochrome P460 family protein [bacterium]|nr:cytochrome P460 family protein [bacterium]
MENLSRLLGPLHPPLVHFAVVCPILAFLALLVNTRWKITWLPQAAAVLWSFSFFSGIGAVLSGHLFALHLGLVTDFSLLPPENALKGHLRDHAAWGTLSFLASFAALAAAYRTFRGNPWPKTAQLAVGFIIAVLFGVTGHEGGEMVFGAEDIPVKLAPQTAALPVDLLVLARDFRQNLVQMNSKPWNSRTHGHRWVNTYVSRESVEAYRNSNPLPVGSLVVKESFEEEGGKISNTPGPLYVMRKGNPSDSPATGGWQYAMEWDHPVAGNPENILTPAKWLPGDGHLNSCVKCHGHFKASDYCGGVPEGFEGR